MRLYEFGAQVIHAIGVETYPAAARLARALRKPLVVTAHDFVSSEEELPWHGGAIPPVIAVCEALRENLVNDGGLPKSSVRVVPVGTDVSRYPAGLPERPGTGSAKVGTPSVCCISPLRTGMGLDTLLRAARRVLDSGKQVEFFLLGAGPAERELRAMAGELGMRANFTFLGAGIEPVQILPSVTLFVMPAPREALISGILQAMACAKPVVAAASGGVFAAVRDGETGLLFPPGDDAAMAAALMRLLSDERLCASMGRAGRELVERDFPVEPMIRGTEAVYSEEIRRTAR